MDVSVPVQFFLKEEILAECEKTPGYVRALLQPGSQGNELRPHKWPTAFDKPVFFCYSKGLG